MMKFRKDFITSAEEIQLNLKRLVSEYESDVSKLTECWARWKDLYAQSIVTEREGETAISSLASARAQLDETRKQIMSTEIMMVEANQPQLNDVRNSEVEFSDQNTPTWTTGNSKIMT